jgi:predicted pyridoxine 5'-phosphate oxidase superfamily flavin-nucleotide-binding protein
MMEAEELEATARRVIDSNQFTTIGTADDEGVPWVSPVWFIAVEYGAVPRSCASDVAPLLL